MTHYHRLAIIYVLAAIITFGASASDPAHSCSRDEPYCVGAERATYVGLLSGAAWPLYWTWTIAEEVRS